MTARKSSRVPTRSNTMNLQRRRNALAGATNSHVFTNQIDQPLPVATDLITSRRFEAIASAAGTGAFTVSTKALIDTLPGTSTVWDKVQFHRFDVFSTEKDALGAYSTLAVTVTNPASGYFGDIPTGYADPVGSTRRAHVAIAMNALFKETWIDSSDTSPLLTIKSSGSANSSAAIQFVCILRSTAGALTASMEGSVDSPLRTRLNSEPLYVPNPVVFELSDNNVVQTAAVMVRG